MVFPLPLPNFFDWYIKMFAMDELSTAKVYYKKKNRCVYLAIYWKLIS